MTRRGGRSIRVQRKLLPPAVSQALGGVQTELEMRFLLRARAAHLPEPLKQFQAVPGRRYAWDFAWPLPRHRYLLVEIHGGIWMQANGQQAGHSTAVGIIRDMEKRNAAVLAGHIQLDFTPEMVESGVAMTLIQQVWEREVAGG